MREKPSPPEQEKSIVAAFIIQDHKLVLVRNVKAFLKDSRHKIRLEPSGGKIEANESIEQAAIREIQEELQVRARLVKTLSNQTTTSIEGSFNVHSVLCETNEIITTTFEEGKLDGVLYATASDLRAWVKNPPENCELAPNIIEQLDELCELLEKNN